MKLMHGGRIAYVDILQIVGERDSWRVAKVRSKAVKVDTCAADIEKINGTLNERSTEL